MYPMPLRILGLAVVAILCLVVGYSAYVVFKRGKPVDPPPEPRRGGVRRAAPAPPSPVGALPARVALASPTRFPSVTVTTYLNLIEYAWRHHSKECLSIPPAYLEEVKAYYRQEAYADLVLLDVVYAGSEAAYARVSVSRPASTGKHRAIRV